MVSIDQVKGALASLNLEAKFSNFHFMKNMEFFSHSLYWHLHGRRDVLCITCFFNF